MPVVKYVEAINQTMHELMEKDERIVIFGAACVGSPWYVGGTLTGLKEKFPKRIIDCPCSENAVTGMVVGMAVMGMRPIMVFPRMDFMLYALDPIINQAAKWSYMFGGRMNVPLVIWAIINGKGSQGAQHSQDFTWIFEMIPGLKVARPNTPEEASGFLRWAIADPNPVIFVDNRELYQAEGATDDCVGIPRHLAPYHPWCPAPCSETLEVAYYNR